MSPSAPEAVSGLLEQVPAPDPAKVVRSRRRRRGRWWWVPGALTVITIASVIVVTLSQLHPSLLLTGTTTTGGDTGAHIAMPRYLESLMAHGHLTGWDPGWYDGFPLYTFYFTIPDAFIAVAGWVIPYGVAFKMGTILGSVMLPVCAWACGRFFRLRQPLPTLLAAATLPFLFDSTFTILGGNLFSTLAGEYAYSFSLSLALLFLGLFACCVREGRHRGWTALVLAGCVLSHIVPAMYALGGAVILTGLEMLPAGWRIGDTGPAAGGVPAAPPPGAPVLGWPPPVSRLRRLWWAGSTVAVGLLLSGWWLVPFGFEHSYTTAMGYTNVEGWAQYFPEADVWALVLAGLGAIRAVVVRSRFGITLTLLGIASALATALDPQGSLYNVRLLPLWFISVYLMAGWAFGSACIVVARAWRHAGTRRWEAAQQRAQSAATLAGQEPVLSGRAAPRWQPAAVGGTIAGLLAVMVVVTPPFVAPASSLPVTLGSNQVTNWSNYNYEGYEGQASYPEYHALMDTMAGVGRTEGCGRAMWEYSESENRFGTPEALMLLPYWTGGCIDSMEGLLFESSTTTPYHFLNQAELSAGPSDPEVGLPYGSLDVTLGVQHLQMLGVRYFIAETPTVEQEAHADPALKLVATSGPWTSDYNGTQTHTTWNVYRVADSPLVTPLRNEPAVLTGVTPAPSSWLGPSVAWYDDPSRWDVELAQSGPASWPRTPVTRIHPAVRPVPTTEVTGITQTDSTVSFHVSRTGTPVLVKVSYFPNWHASGADGPWRVTPNLMVVVPTSHEVTLSYGGSAADALGLAATVVGLVGLVALFVVPFVFRRRPRARSARPPSFAPPGPPAPPRPTPPATP